jgi:hypothetical protein
MQENYKAPWAPLINHTVRTTAPPVPTQIQPWLHPLYHPRFRHRTAAPGRTSRRHLPTASDGNKKEHPSPWSSPFLLLLLSPPCLPSLSHREPPPGPPSNLPTPPRAPHRRRELPRTSCQRSRLLLCSTTIAPRRSVCTAMEPRALVSPPLSSSTGLISLLVVPSEPACVMLSGLYPCKVDY